MSTLVGSFNRLVECIMQHFDANHRCIKAMQREIASPHCLKEIRECVVHEHDDELALSYGRLVEAAKEFSRHLKAQGETP